ncbi:LysR family transcriptional regulator [Streptomyces sp. NPDC059142]|uniref:LysR family transcriptional regulator n=1 Tax=Streptomyces sp. NPDC059142 TaxID=3346739 RepID=UPI0036C1042D
MDLVRAALAFVHVSERGSFTIGAAAARMSQSVASRRVAALERHLGEVLLERNGRRVALTPFGQDVLPAARRLLRAADALEDEAETARGRRLRLAVPDTCSTGRLARLVAGARRDGVPLELCLATPSRRAELLHSQEVRAALIALPPAEATWQVPLGLAGARDPEVERVYVETLRPGRTDTAPYRRIWIQPEDDVPHIRDPLKRLCDAVGLRPSQHLMASGLAAGAAEALYSDDLLLCSRAEAADLRLAWRPLGEVELVRGFAVVADTGGESDRIRQRLGEHIGRCLDARAGAVTAPRAGTVPGTETVTSTGTGTGPGTEDGAPREA